ncbi:uncharacterized protein LY89DRAFT_729907 [Mollisia scopiformis]|uniref:Uncharacterized protein n=1 Tax=Mollisia scopiformis TaxID=149040 RepID=A0A194XMV5_MOLSC|nr:uncharacterized protein LY89DRAFT_729907 [Mollisia scopiformis]KUJ21107.1 hypothetical protein LY89DRAFT_729907 [Mollisia scopiformis]
MRCFILSIILGFAILSQALPQVLQSRSNAASRPQVFGNHVVTSTDAVVLQDFLISSISANSTALATQGSFNRSVSFVFNDPNSNTSTTCSTNWTDTATSSTGPMGPSYLVCTEPTAPGKEQWFDWYFGSYTDHCHFSFELAHEWSDPAVYPPPYDYVEYFASMNVSLTYTDAAGLFCNLPTATGPLHAVITSISN